MARQFQRRLTPNPTPQQTPLGAGIDSFVNSLNNALIRNQQNQEAQKRQDNSLEAALTRMIMQQNFKKAEDENPNKVAPKTNPKSASAEKQTVDSNMKQYKMLLEQARNDEKTWDNYVKSDPLAAYDPQRKEQLKDTFAKDPQTAPVHQRLVSYQTAIPKIFSSLPALKNVYPDIASQFSESGNQGMQMPKNDLEIGGDNAIK